MASSPPGEIVQVCGRKHLEGKLFMQCKRNAVRNGGSDTDKASPATCGYRLLPKEQRPSYRTRADLGLLRYAFRHDWVRGVPAERLSEWIEDIFACAEASKSPRLQESVIKAVLDMKRAQFRWKKELMNSILPPNKRGSV